VLPCNHSWWSTHYTPNGWKCSCWIRPVSRGDLDRMGKDGPDQAPETKYVTWIDKNTGTHHKVPEGIDPGFDYNPGQAWKAPVKAPQWRCDDGRDTHS